MCLYLSGLSVERLGCPPTIPGPSTMKTNGNLPTLRLLRFFPAFPNSVILFAAHAGPVDITVLSACSTSRDPWFVHARSSPTQTLYIWQHLFIPMKDPTRIPCHSQTSIVAWVASIVLDISIVHGVFNIYHHHNVCLLG